MPTILERHWPKLALLLTLALFAGLLFVPALAQGFATLLLALTLGMGLLLLVLRHWRNYRAGKLSWLELARRNRLPVAGFCAGAAGRRACG